MEKKPGGDELGGTARVGSNDSARALGFAFALNTAFVIFELTSGLASGSLALISDAVHNLSDVVALAMAWVAQALSRRPPSARLTYGLQRLEVLGAQANALLLGAAAVGVAISAIRRMANPPEVPGSLVAVVAGAGVVVNAVSAWTVWRSGTRNLNSKAAALNLAADVALSAIALGAGVAIALTGASWLDPAASLAIAALMAVAAVQMLRAVSHILLEGVPPHIDLDAVLEFLERQPGVRAVHHVHVWNLSSENAALSGHLVFEGEMSLHEAQIRGEQLREALRERFGIEHATLELECHPCKDDSVIVV